MPGDAVLGVGRKSRNKSETFFAEVLLSFTITITRKSNYNLFVHLQGRTVAVESGNLQPKDWIYCTL